MKSDIEKVLQADDAAGKAVEAARVEAELIRARARKAAEEFVAAKEEELSVSLLREQEAILAESASRAKSIKEEADAYIGRVRSRKESVLDDLVARLLKKVTGV